MGVDTPVPTSVAIELVDGAPADALAVALPHSDVPPEERLFRHWLDGRNPATIAGYRSDLADFASFLRRPDGTPLVPHSDRRNAEENARAAHVAISAFIAIGNARGAGAANAVVLAYRAHLSKQGTAPRTVNRRMAAIRSMLKVARLIGLVTWTIEIDRVRVADVRDTAGPGKDAVATMMDALVGGVDAGERDAIRNLAILRLLYDLGLRRGEVASLDVEHWEPARRRLWVWGKKRAEREPRDNVPVDTAQAIDAWIEFRGPELGPLFVSFSPRDYGRRLTGWGVWSVVTELAASLGLRARPHGVRHTAITDVLDESHGDVRAAQRFSRHASLATLQIYDDNRKNLGAELAAKIAAGMPGLGRRKKDTSNG